MLTAIAAWGAGVLLPAAEPTRSGAAPDDDPIAAAKREFDKARAERGSGEQLGKGGLPKFELPEMQQTGGTPLATEAQKKKRVNPAEKKSGNWLLEAMERKTETRDGRVRTDGSGVTRSDENAPLTNDATKTESVRTESVGEAIVREAAGDARGEKNSNANERQPRRTEPAPNPLARYMGEWMTPQDYTLLKPVVDASARGADASGAVAVTSAAATAPSVSLSPAGEIGAETRSAARAGFIPPTPQDNPYLQLLNAPSSSAPMVSAPPTQTLPSSSAPAAVALPPPAPDPSKSRIPDFAKPLDDQKYFKQLKRF